MTATATRARRDGGLAPGTYDMPAAAYHADPCEQPSLSASVAALLCQRSPKHAWAAHPRLNPAHERVDKQVFDVGTASHAMLLQGEDICEPVDAPDWRTKVAREARDAIRERGKIPLLLDQWERVREMVAAVRPQLELVDAAPPLLAAGKAEQTLVWQERGVTCRARLDWLHDDRRAIDDLKSTSRSAHPADWARSSLWGIGADIQAAFYRRGLRALTGADADFRWCVVETAPPYAVSVISLSQSALALANDKVNWAITTWGECLRSGNWPAYGTEVAYAEAPPWEEARWLELRQYDPEDGR